MPDEHGDPLYSLAHLTLINATAPELIYIAARAGYDAVSPRFIQMNAATNIINIIIIVKLLILSYPTYNN